MTLSHSRFVGREQGSRVVSLVCLLAAWAVLAWPWLSGRVTIPWDAKAHFLPQLQFLATSFARGESPFWTPNVFAGSPQIADPQSLIFSPPFLLLALFNPAPTAWAADATLFALVLVSMASLFVWLTDKGWHSAAALLSALAFGFGAAMAWRIQHVGQVMSLAYLPITLLLLDRALSRKSWLYAAGAGLAAGCLVLGRDQVALLAVYFLIAYVVGGWFTAGDRAEAFRKSLAPLWVAGLTGVLVIAVPVLLTALTAMQSNRPSIDFLGAGHGSLHPALFLTALAPDVFGSSGNTGEYWGPPSFRWKDTQLYIAQNMGQMYLGALPAALLIWGAVTGVIWRPGARLFSGALVVAVLFGLGWYTPAFKLMHSLLPGVDLYRRPADAVFLIGFLAAVLAGFCLNEILSEPAVKLHRVQKLTLFGAPAAAFVLMCLLAYHFDKLGDAWPAILIPAVALSAAGGMLYAFSGIPVPVMTAVGGVALFMAADLGYSNAPGGATGLPPPMYDVLDPDTANETIALLKQKVAASESATRRDRVELVGFGFHWPNASLTHQLENTLGYNPLRLGLYTRATGAGDHSGVPDQKNFSPLFPSYRSNLADLLGLRYIASSVPIDQIDKRLQPGDVTLVAKTADGFVYENPRALPRVMFASQSVRADFDDLLASGKWPEVDLQTTVVLEAEQNNAPRQAGSARIVSYSNTVVSIECDSPNGGYVVLNDVWHPWWFARVDGRDVPILKANVLFRAVAVAPGRHRIDFSFEPLRGAAAELRAKWSG